MSQFYKYDLEEAYSLSDTTNISVKIHINKIQQITEQIKNELSETKNNQDILKSDLNDMSLSLNTMHSDLTSLIFDSIYQFKQQVRELNNEEQIESWNLKKQINMLNDDKLRIQQDILYLEDRILETDKDIGFQRQFRDVVNKKKK